MPRQKFGFRAVRPAANAHTKPKVTFGLGTPVPKRIIEPLTSNSEKLYLLG